MSIHSDSTSATGNCPFQKTIGSPNPRKRSRVATLRSPSTNAKVHQSALPALSLPLSPTNSSSLERNRTGDSPNQLTEPRLDAIVDSRPYIKFLQDLTHKNDFNNKKHCAESNRKNHQVSLLGDSPLSPSAHPLKSKQTVDSGVASYRGLTPPTASTPARSRLKPPRFHQQLQTQTETAPISFNLTLPTSPVSCRTAQAAASAHVLLQPSSRSSKEGGANSSSESISLNLTPPASPVACPTAGAAAHAMLPLSQPSPVGAAKADEEANLKVVHVSERIAEWRVAGRIYVLSRIGGPRDEYGVYEAFEVVQEEFRPSFSPTVVLMKIDGENKIKMELETKYLALKRKICGFSGDRSEELRIKNNNALSGDLKEKYEALQLQKYWNSRTGTVCPVPLFDVYLWADNDDDYTVMEKATPVSTKSWKNPSVLYSELRTKDKELIDLMRDILTTGAWNGITNPKERQEEKMRREAQVKAGIPEEETIKIADIFPDCLPKNIGRNRFGKIATYDFSGPATTPGAALRAFCKYHWGWCNGLGSRAILKAQLVNRDIHRHLCEHYPQALANYLNEQLRENEAYELSRQPTADGEIVDANGMVLITPDMAGF